MTDAQRQKLLTAIAERRAWLQQLQDRMMAIGWNPGDETYRALLNAIDAHQRLMKTFGA